MSHRGKVRIAAAGLLLLASGAVAVEPAVLVDGELRRQAIQFLSLAEGRLRYFGEDRNLTEKAAAEAVRLEFARTGAAEEAGELRLNDGQAVRGAFAGVGDDGKLKWETTSLGLIEVLPDDISSFQVTAKPVTAEGRQSPVAGAETAESDTVLLSNGDRLTGFIDAFTPGGVKLNREDGQAVDLPWDAVGSARLANPIRRKPGVFVTLTTGAYIRVQGLYIAGERVTGSALGKSIDLPVEMVSAVDFAERHRLIPLRDLPHRVTSGGAAFGVDYPPMFRADHLELHAPLVLQFDLPQGASRFAAEAELSPDGLEWGDMVLTVLDRDGELITRALDAAQPKLEINAELRGRTLILHLDDAVHGPIQDRLVIRGPVVLVGTR